MTLKKWPSNWDFLPSEKSLIFVENHVYCDVISGKVTELGCSGDEVFVNQTGFARILIPASHRVGVLAIHLAQRVM